MVNMSESHTQTTALRDRSSLSRRAWIWAIVLTILVAPPFYVFESIAAAFAQAYAPFGDYIPLATRSLLASSASIAADLRIALAVHGCLLIALAVTAKARTAFFGVAICNLVILLVVAAILYAPMFVLAR